MQLPEAVARQRNGIRDQTYTTVRIGEADPRGQLAAALPGFILRRKAL